MGGSDKLASNNPRENLAYFLETVQWFDATTPPLQKHHLWLTEHVQRLLSIDGNSGPATTDVPPERKADRTSFAPATRWVIAFGLLALAAVIATAWLFFSALRSLQQTASSTNTQRAVLGSAFPEMPTKSIAVLPFESLSANKDDTYFADGFQDEILNNLAKIAQLAVISRTSVMQYRAIKTDDALAAGSGRI
jgi:hypothetical protein